MLIESKSQDGVLVARPRIRRLDARVADRFTGNMTKFIRAGNRRILLNLDEVCFIDSSGLGAILAVSLSLRNRGALGLCGARRPVRELFRLTRLDHHLLLYPSQQAGIQALGGLRRHHPENPAKDLVIGSTSRRNVFYFRHKERKIPTEKEQRRAGFFSTLRSNWS